MGVPKFYNQWFRRENFKGVITRSIRGKVSSLMIDMNGVLHPVAQKTFRYQDYKGIRFQDDEIYIEIVEEIKKSGKKTPNLNNKNIYLAHMRLFEKLLTSYLNTLYHRLMPHHLIVLAVDGVVPQAKIAQQRSRRFGGITKSGKFDPNAITPGTPFMQRVDVMIKKWAMTITEKVDEVIYSSHLVPGEGEHKIMDFIREGYVNGPYNHVIHGLDADLIMLTTVAPSNNLYLYRERDIFDLKTVKVDVVNIDLLRDELKRIRITPDDFVIVSLFIGNDFLPHQPSLEDFNNNMVVLINALHKLSKPLTHNGEIIWERLYRFLRILAKEEPKLLLEESKKPVMYPSRMLTSDLVISYKIDPEGGSETILDYTQFRNAWYTNEFKYRVLPEQSQIYQKITGTDLTFGVNDVDMMCKEYLTGIAWVYHYYTHGMNTVNLNWYYPFYHTPLFSDLTLKMDLVSRKAGSVLEWESKGAKPLHPIQQLLSVLPLSSKKLIPKEYHKYMTKVFPQYYPIEFELELDGKTVEWMGVPILPFVDPFQIRSQVVIEGQDRWLQINLKTGNIYHSVIYFQKDFDVNKRVFRDVPTFRARPNKGSTKRNVKGQLKHRGNRKRSFFVPGKRKNTFKPKIKIMKGWGVSQN